VIFKNNLKDKEVLIGSGALVVIFAVLNLIHQQYFKDELSFWSQAVKTSPNSAYALMMLGAKLEDPDEGARLFRQAYAMDSTEKYINYYYGAMLQYQDSILESERYLLAEKDRSNYVECDYMLARVYVEKGELFTAIGYLETFIGRAPMHELAHTNLLQLYLQTGDLERAKDLITSMDQKGIPVAEDLRRQAGL
jgi:tetratricopeptide (TPR) repeat protein